MLGKKIAISNIPCAVLSKKVKQLNGKSAERLRASIIKLNKVLMQQEETNREG